MTDSHIDEPYHNIRKKDRKEDSNSNKLEHAFIAIGENENQTNYNSNTTTELVSVSAKSSDSNYLLDNAIEAESESNSQKNNDFQKLENSNSSGDDINRKTNSAWGRQFTTSPNPPNRKGTMIMCLYNSKNYPLICIGPHWPFTLCFISFLSGISCLYFYGLWGWLNIYVKYIGWLIFLTQFISYSGTALINPGLPSPDLWWENFDNNKNKLLNYRICQRCQWVMNWEKGTQHCSDCDVCVEGMDHHCPWTSKCVGKNNLYIFYVFVISTFILIFYWIFGICSWALFQKLEEDKMKYNI